MSRAEAECLMGWAIREGWNPGVKDLDAAWQADPEAFIALRYQGGLVGGGSILSHGGLSGYMGLFIVDPAYRGRGWGTQLWFERLQRLQRRLQGGAPISMAGVQAMVPFYERGGFIAQHEDVRYEGVARGDATPLSVPLTQIDFQTICEFDSRFVLAPRPDFLRHWLSYNQGVGLMRDGELRAYGVLRRAQHGYKVGPAYALDEHSGIGLLEHLFSMIPGETVQADIPSTNLAARHFLEASGFSAVFSCVHMVHPNGRSAPARLPTAQIFGISSLEFG